MPLPLGNEKCSSKRCCRVVSSCKGDWRLPPRFSATGRGQIHAASASVLCPAPEPEHLGPVVVGKVSFYPPLSWGQEENQLSMDRILGNAVYQLLLSICNQIFFQLFVTWLHLSIIPHCRHKCTTKGLSVTHRLFSAKFHFLASSQHTARNYWQNCCSNHW